MYLTYKVQCTLQFVKLIKKALPICEQNIIIHFQEQNREVNIEKVAVKAKGIK